MYEYWLEQMFIPSTAHLNRALLLIIDGHASHLSLKIIELLKANQIICLILPSHSRHALQPLDVVVFNAVKRDWSAIVKNHLKEGNKSVKNYEFPRLIKKLFIDKAAFSSSRIVSSFARAGKSITFRFQRHRNTVNIPLGIWPFDPTAMRDKVARNSMKIPAPTSTSVSSVPRNILQPRLASSTLPALLTQTAGPYHHIAPSTSTNTPIITTSDAFTTIVSVESSSSPSNTLDQIMPLLPTILIKEDDLLDPVSPPASTMLQSCPLDLTLNPRSEERKHPASPKQSRKRLQSSITTGMFSLLKIRSTHMLTLSRQCDPPVGHGIHEQFRPKVSFSVLCHFECYLYEI